MTDDGPVLAIPTGRTLASSGAFVLRSPRPADAERMFVSVTDPDTQQFAIPAFVSSPSSPNVMGRAIAASLASQADGEPAMFVVAADTEPDHLLGTVSWRHAGDPRAAVAALGYDTHPDSRGRGVAVAGVQMLTRLLIGAGFARVEVSHSEENPASCRVADRAGFAREGRRRGFLPFRDLSAGGVRRHDMCEHGILASEVEP
jgi:RimJ/RimL family protein N-acetyltransferase